MTHTGHAGVPEWWCLHAQAPGELWTEDSAFVTDGALRFFGAVLAYRSKDEADVAAAAARTLYPRLHVQAIRMPPAPPTVSGGSNAPSKVVSLQLDVSSRARPDTKAMIEVRPAPEGDPVFAARVTEGLAVFIGNHAEFLDGEIRVLSIGVPKPDGEASEVGDVHEAIKSVMGDGEAT